LLKAADKFIQQGLLVIASETKQSVSIDEILKTTSKGAFLADGLASELFILN